MPDDKQPTAVTRGELYPILGGIYLLIAFAFAGLLRSDDQDVLLVIVHLLMFGVALASSVTFTILGIRERNRGAREKRDLAEPFAPAGRPRE
jgi:hypothetical protein